MQKEVSSCYIIINDDEEDGLQIIKTVNYATISDDDDDDDDDVKFIKKTPSHLLAKDLNVIAKII